MRKILYVLVLVVLVGCVDRSQKSQSAAQTTPETQEASAETQNSRWEHKDVDWNNRRVFYVIWEKEDGSYSISKRDRLFIVDDKVLIEEIPHEPFVFPIRKIEYLGDSLIVATLDDKLITSQYYTALLAGEELYWMESGPEDKPETRKVILTKNKSTLIWELTYGDEPGRAEFIDTYDILPSGYYYQNQRTTRHDPERETFVEPEKPNYTGVFDLDEKPVNYAFGSDEYNAMERPYEGTWLEMKMTDIGYVVYDYPSLFDEEQTHSPIFIGIEGDRLSWQFPSDPVEVSTFDEVAAYLKDGSYCFKAGSFYYSFKWVDPAKHIGQWTQYYEQNGKINIWNQELYIDKDHNEFPVIMYDWD